MSASSSNLASPKYGYDLVCATTQDAINVTMKRFLSHYDGTEFTACYTFDLTSFTAVETPLAQIQKVTGVDPFSIPNGSTDSSPPVRALWDQKFQYAFRAKLGVPIGLAPSAVPDVVILDKGNQAVSYQLFCAEFDVMVLEQEFGSGILQHYTQDPKSPWIFLFEVNIGLEGTSFESLPPAVQQNVKNLNPATAFSVQQLYVDLNTPGLQQLPLLTGLDPATDAYVQLTKIFVNKYWNTVNQGSDKCILGYSVAPATSPASTTDPVAAATITPTDLTLEVSPYLDASGKPTTNYGVYTLNYLVMSHGTPMPPAVPFAWNWVDADEEADFHGVIAIRAPIFVTFLQDLITPQLQLLNYSSNISLTHDGMDFSEQISFNKVPSPALAFTVASPLTPDSDDDGYTEVLKITYATPSHDDSENSMHLNSIHGDFNYDLNGDVAFGPSSIRVTMEAVLYLQFNEHDQGITVQRIDQNVFDRIVQTVYELTITPDGRLQVVAKTEDTDKALPWDWGGHGEYDMTGLRDSASAYVAQLNTAIDGYLQTYENDITTLLNGSTGWVYPGGNTFVFKDVGFSSGQDLIAHITYADPA